MTDRPCGVPWRLTAISTVPPPRAVSRRAGPDGLRGRSGAPTSAQVQEQGGERTHRRHGTGNDEGPPLPGGIGRPRSRTGSEPGLEVRKHDLDGVEVAHRGESQPDADHSHERQHARDLQPT